MKGLEGKFEISDNKKINEQESPYHKKNGYSEEDINNKLDISCEEYGIDDIDSVDDFEKKLEMLSREDTLAADRENFSNNIKSQEKQLDELSQQLYNKPFDELEEHQKKMVSMKNELNKSTIDYIDQLRGNDNGRSI